MLTIDNELNIDLFLPELICTCTFLTFLFKKKANLNVIVEYFLFLFHRGFVGEAGTGWCSAWISHLYFIYLNMILTFFCSAFPVLDGKGQGVNSPSWEEAFRCSRRSQPNTFSLLPTFLRTLLILPCFEFNPTWLNSTMMTLVLPSGCQKRSAADASAWFATGHGVVGGRFPVASLHWSRSITAGDSRLTASLDSSSALQTLQSVRRHKISKQLYKSKRDFKKRKI